MPGERKPSFTVVSGVVAFLAVFGWLTRVLEPAIPPVESNAMAAEAAEFLRQGATQRVQWRAISSDPFAEARRKNLPIMLLVGVPWSKFGRDLDRFVFTSNDVATFLGRNFISVRIDASERPDWLNTYLPASRARLGLLPGLQIWFLDPQGQMFDLIVRADGDVRVDPQAFIDTLVQVRKRYEGGLVGDDGEGTRPAALQARDIMALRSPSLEALPNLEAHNDVLQQITDRKNGGFPLRNMQRLMPNAWLYQLITGRTDAMRASLEPVLRTGIVDHLDGGFFRLATTSDWNRIEFDKVAVQQAEMMRLLALSAALTGSRYHRVLAEESFDSLMGEFLSGGYVRASRVGDEARMDRSQRSSFSVSVLRNLRLTGSLSSADLEYARDVMGLRVETNRPMSVQLTDPAQAEAEPFRRVLDILRKHIEPNHPDFAGDSLLDVNGLVAARSIECARLWGSKERLSQALALSDRLDEFRAGDDVRHSLAPGRTDYAYLGDYLAYSDAKLQDFLATGRAHSFTDGLAVLRRAMVLFKGERSGLYNTGLSLPGARAMPEIVDNFCESLTGRMIRLQDAYGRLLAKVVNGKPSAPAVELRQAAFAGATKLSESAQSIQFGASGYFCAVLGLMNEGYAVTVGPDAERLANELYRRLPTRLIAPAVDAVRPDLQKREPGIYLVDGLTVQGPLTVDQAAQGLSVNLRTN